jgi:hypothetical protein
MLRSCKNPEKKICLSWKNKMKCIDCSSQMYEYEEGEWTVWICWECGYYKSDSEGYALNPKLFENMVRNNPTYYLNKYLFTNRKLNRDLKKSLLNLVHLRHRC